MRRIASRLWSGRTPVVLLGVLLFNTVYLAYSNRRPEPQRAVAVAYFYGANVVLHLLLGLGACVLVLIAGRQWRRAIARTAGAGKLAGALSALAVSVCLASGLALLIWGNLSNMQRVLAAHGIGAVVAAASGVLWLMARARQPAAPSHSSLSPQPASLLRAAAIVLTIGIVSGGALCLAASRESDVASRIVNSEYVPATMEQEGDGPSGPYWPSSVQQVKDEKFFPPEYFTDSKSCGEQGCHPDIYKQWYSSAHHFSSFNNQWYRKSIEYMQDVVGTQPSKWCGGCHDMAILLTEMPKTGKSRFDFPIKDQIYPASAHPEAHAGIGCAACHSMVHIGSTMGNGGYVADYPPMHQFVISKNPFMRAATKFLLRLAPDPHRKTFLKPFHRMDTAKFCSACHKVHLDVPVNHYRWTRGFDDYDAWQGSGVSGFGARSFYYPAKDGKPNFQKCADCHMPLTASLDAGNLSGFVHSHRFVAANTALPWANHDTEQMALVQKFLKDGALSIDIFALRRPKGTSKGDREAGRQGERAGSRSAGVDQPEGQASSLNGDVATGGEAGSIVQASTGPVNEDVIAPLNRGAVAVKRGEDALIDVVVRTRKVGHAFPGGTFDAFDVWTELQAVDETGKTLFWSGCLDYPGGPVEKGAHRFRVLQVDAHDNAINKRNAWAARARIYAHAIPPGADETIHYRLHIPKSCGKHITLTAKLNYRKFSWFNTAFSFHGRLTRDEPATSKSGILQGVATAYDHGTAKTSGLVTPNYDDRPVALDADTKVVAAKDPNQPIDPPVTTLCSDSVSLDTTDGDPAKATAPRALDPTKDRDRWQDYGIGLMLQGDFQRATKAFHTETNIAPQWPEGYVNIGRVRLLEGDMPEARGSFERAFSLYDAKPTPMTRYYRARTQFFYGQVLKEQSGDYDGAMNAWRACAAIFPYDREVHNQMGRVYFLEQKFSEARGEFLKVLEIDPEDLSAHYNLMLVCRGLGDAKAADLHAQLYRRFKNDETATQLEGPYLRSHPDDNNESLPVHEHISAPLPRPTAPPAHMPALKDMARVPIRGGIDTRKTADSSKKRKVASLAAARG